MEHGDEVIAEAAAAAATKIAAGCGDELMPRDTPGVFATPVTAARYASLAGRATADDMFSSDLTDEELAAKLGHVAAREGRGKRSTLWVFSGADEYVPEYVKEDYASLAKRICRAAGAVDDDALPFEII